MTFNAQKLRKNRAQKCWMKQWKTPTFGGFRTNLWPEQQRHWPILAWYDRKWLQFWLGNKLSEAIDKQSDRYKHTSVENNSAWIIVL